MKKKNIPKGIYLTTKAVIYYTAKFNYKKFLKQKDKYSKRRVSFYFIEGFVIGQKEVHFKRLTRKFKHSKK